MSARSSWQCRNWFARQSNINGVLRKAFPKQRGADFVRLPLLTGLILMLAACGSGNSEDFALEVKRAPKDVSASLGSIRLSSAATAAFADMKLQVDRYSDKEIVYSIPMEAHPGSKTAPATIRFKLDPMAGETATVVHVYVDVPPIRVLMGEANKELSEAKVEAELKKSLTIWAKDMAMGSSSRASTAKFSDLFASVAVAGNFRFQSQVNAAKAGFMPRSALSDDRGSATFAEPEVDRDQERFGDPVGREDQMSVDGTFDSGPEADAGRPDQTI